MILIWYEDFIKFYEKINKKEMKIKKLEKDASDQFS